MLQLGISVTIEKKGRNLKFTITILVASTKHKKLSNQSPRHSLCHENFFSGKLDGVSLSNDEADWAFSSVFMASSRVSGSDMNSCLFCHLTWL